MVTVGSLQAGAKENVIPDEAVIKLNVRTFDEGVRTRVLAAITRIVNAEAAAADVTGSVRAGSRGVCPLMTSSERPRIR